MAATLSSSRRLRLIRQLCTAERTLAEWLDSLSDSAAAFPAAPSGQPTEAQRMSLIQLLKETRECVLSRLAELHPSDSEVEQARKPPKGQRACKPLARSRSAYELCLRACRGCGRVLGMAFCVAQAVEDTTTAQALYASVRAFEKQLWVLNPRVA